MHTSKIYQLSGLAAKRTLEITRVINLSLLSSLAILSILRSIQRFSIDNFKFPNYVHSVRFNHILVETN